MLETENNATLAVRSAEKRTDYETCMAAFHEARLVLSEYIRAALPRLLRP
jgi:hypothetical protein